MACSSAVIVTQCIASIKRVLISPDKDQGKIISTELTILKAELDKELAIRVLAAKEVGFFTNS